MCQDKLVLSMNLRLEQKGCKPCHDLMIMKTITFDNVKEYYFLKEEKKDCRNARKR